MWIIIRHLKRQESIIYMPNCDKWNYEYRPGRKVSNRGVNNNHERRVREHERRKSEHRRARPGGKPPYDDRAKAH